MSPSPLSAPLPRASEQLVCEEAESLLPKDKAPFEEQILRCIVSLGF